jgi:hypothetical protein
MKLSVLLALSLAAFAQEPQKRRIDGYLLASDSRCHYIIQGARIEQLRSLNQQGGSCQPWQAFVRASPGMTIEQVHLAALKRYMEEVKAAWPDPKPEWLQVDLAKIDKEK